MEISRVHSKAFDASINEKFVQQSFNHIKLNFPENLQIYHKRTGTL